MHEPGKGEQVTREISKFTTFSGSSFRSHLYFGSLTGEYPAGRATVWADLGSNTAVGEVTRVQSWQPPSSRGWWYGSNPVALSFVRDRSSEPPVTHWIFQSPAGLLQATSEGSIDDPVDPIHFQNIGMLTDAHCDTMLDIIETARAARESLATTS